jgi:hypothetical protein
MIFVMNSKALEMDLQLFGKMKTRKDFEISFCRRKKGLWRNKSKKEGLK